MLASLNPPLSTFLEGADYDLAATWSGDQRRMWWSTIDAVSGVNATSPFSMMVVGGSMAAGIGCHESRRYGKECAYSKRFFQWLQESVPEGERAHMHFVNTAVGGTTTGGILPSIRMLMNSVRPPPNLLLIDFSVNDAAEGQDWIKYRASISLDGVNADVLAATEQLIRYVREYHPSTNIVMVEGMCHTKWFHSREAHARVATTYGIPLISYPKLLGVGSDLCDQPAFWGGGQTHPTWEVHHAMAIMMSQTWMREKVRKAGPQPFTLSTEAKLDEFAVCVDPLFSFDAYDPSKQNPGYQVLSGTWEWMEDRPGKPGLISTVANSTVEFPVQFGKKPRLVVVYLRSYERMGTMYLSIPTQNRGVIPISGIDGAAVTHGVRVSQVHVLNINVMQHGWQPAMGVDGVLGFGIQSNTKHRVRITTDLKCASPDACKVKLVGLYSC